jgi:hypothetical protein
MPARKRISLVLRDLRDLKRGSLRPNTPVDLLEAKSRESLAVSGLSELKLTVENSNYLA